MTTRSLFDEAKYCREVADDLDASEKPFMNAVADAFEELASRDRRKAASTTKVVDARRMRWLCSQADIGG